MLREVVLDTETTGLNFQEGHRVVEIGCIELINGKETGNTFQHYIHPMRDMPYQAYQVHGLSAEFLQKFPTFDRIVSLFCDFIQNSALIIHNAKFDIGFLNFELERAGQPSLTNPIVDTLDMARKKFPGAPASLDALCRRFSVSLEERSYHGALLDAHLLSQIYGHLHIPKTLDLPAFDQNTFKHKRPFRKPRTFSVSSEEQAAHSALINKLL